MDNKIEANFGMNTKRLPVVNILFEDSDDSNVICPPNRLFDRYTGSCAEYPFEMMPLIYTTQFETQDDGKDYYYIKLR